MSTTKTTNNIVDIRDGWMIYHTTVHNGEHMGFYVFAAKNSDNDDPFPSDKPTPDRTEVHSLGCTFSGAELDEARKKVYAEIESRRE